MKELLIRISDNPLEKQQEELDHVIESWKGKEPQVDDILVFGIKFV